MMTFCLGFGLVNIWTSNPWDKYQ